MNKSFFINSQITKKGLALKTPKGTYQLIYPTKIWQAYPEDLKNILKDNLTFLLTVDSSIVSGLKSIKYNTSIPFFMPFFFNIIVKSIPWAIEDYPYDTKEVIKQFLNTKFYFEKQSIRIPEFKASYIFKEKAIIPLSFGKDSLLTLALAIELGLKPICVYINDTISPKENEIKLKMAEKVSKEFNLKIHIVTNQIEKLNDFELWGKNESCLGYMHMVTGFCFILLPFVHFYKTKYILVGNQQDMNFTFENKDGYMTSASPDQYSDWTKLNSAAISLMTRGQTQVVSIIEPLANIAIAKLLHVHYPEFGKYEVSCDSLDVSEESRWCHDCSKCARLSLFMKAVGANAKKAGFKKDLLSKRHRNLYTLFDGEEVDIYESSLQAKKQQLLAFYLAYKRGEKGALIEKFKKDLLPQVEKEINLLKKEFFHIYNTELPPIFKRKLLPLLEELLQK
jgi:7-cyano-7-deazaguanine synthase in queuosine biosynthesis